MRKLTLTLGGVREPQTCQKCRRTAEQIRATGGYLELWEECDEKDEPSGVFLFLCVACDGDSENSCPDRELIAAGQARRRKKGVIEAHERLYVQRDVNAPFPGLIWFCGRCVHRDELKCNAGKVVIEIDSPARVCGKSGAKGLGKSWTQLLYPNPARTCSAWESADGEPFVPLPEKTREERVEEWRAARRARQEAHIQEISRELSPAIAGWLDARADMTREESES